MLLLSHSLSSSTPEYANKETLNIHSICDIQKGDTCNKMGLSLDLHTGSHIDFPKHFCENGASIDDTDNYGIYYFLKWKLIDLNVKPKSLIKDFEHSKSESDNQVTLVLFRTGWESRRIDKRIYALDGPGLHAGLANKLIERYPNLVAVGFDFISLTSYSHREHGRIAHKEFLCNSNLVILEDLKLANFNEVDGEIQVVPWQIKNADGAPVTVIWSKK